MQTTKYVRHAVKGFFLWDALSDVTHWQLVRALGMNQADIYSAGFVQWHGGQPRCTGVSTSLGIGSKPSDSAALMGQLGIVPVGQVPPISGPVAAAGHA